MQYLFITSLAALLLVSPSAYGEFDGGDSPPPRTPKAVSAAPEPPKPSSNDKPVTDTQQPNNNQGNDQNQGKAQNNQSQAPAPKPDLAKTPEMGEFTKSAVQTNTLKNTLQSGVQNNEAVTAQYQASANQTALLKAKLDDMAQSGKYETKNYKEAVTALSIPTMQFNYQPGKSSGSDNSQATAPTPTPSQPPETVTTQGIDVSAAATPEPTPGNLPVPSNEIADTRVPVDEAPARTLSNDNGPISYASGSSGFTSVPGGVAPLNLNSAAPASPGKPSDSLSMPELKSDTGTATSGNSPSRGLASTSETGEELSDEEMAALVASKVLNDRKNKAGQKDGAANTNQKQKPSLAERLKNSTLNTANNTFGAKPISADPSATSEAGAQSPTSLKDELFWFGPQKFGRMLLTTVGADKNISGEARRAPNSLGAATASDWLQVLLGWMAAAGVMLSAGMAVARKKFSRPSRPRSSDDHDDDRPRREPTVK